MEPAGHASLLATLARHRRHLIALSVLVLVAWASGISADFVWIDHVEIEQGGYRVLNFADWRAIWTTSLDQYLERNQGELLVGGGYLRPLYGLSLSLDWTLWNADPGWYHIENIVWHLLVVIGLYALGIRLLQRHQSSPSLAFWSAALVAVHPFGVHSVTWISGRKDLMCALFSVLSLLLFLKVVDIQKEGMSYGKGLACGLLFALAVASKEAAFVLPLIASACFLIERSGNRDSALNCRGAHVALLCVWLSAVAAMGWRYAAVGGVGLDADYPSSSLQGNVGTYARLWWWYVARVLAPMDPTIVDRWPVTHEIGGLELAALLGLLALAALTLWGLRRRSPLVHSGVWYVAWMLPVSGFLPLRHVYAERYLYPAMWGLTTLFVAVVFVLVSKWPRVRQTFLGGLVGLLLLITITEIPNWRNDEVLFAHSIQQDRNYAEGRTALAVIALRNEQYADAAAHAQIALATAEDPNSTGYWSPFVTHSNLGLALYSLGKFAEAEHHFVKAKHARPRNAISHYHLGLNATAQGDLHAAEQHYLRALEFNSSDYLTLSNLGFIYLSSGRLDECIALLQPLVAERTEETTDRANLGTAFLLSGRFAEAEPQFEVLARQQPSVAVHLAKLAWSEWKQGKTSEALPHLFTAARIDRDHPTVELVARMVLQEHGSDSPP